MRGVGKRSEGGTSEGPPDERGGNSYVQPTATAPHLDSTNPNIEFFGLDDVMPGNLNERVPREHAKIPNVRNWAVRDYGNRVGIWRIMEVLTRHGIRARR